ncbi:hypothetical protein [Sphingomonas sp. PB4P5]|uniref:hypothetical protein n=1 Tax=Parasphingomonas puruogangriensis TaxID=3096155 RepID=UPI002FC8B2A6
MRIVFFNRFYAPDHSATAQLLSDVTEYVAAAGREVSSRPAVRYVTTTIAYCLLASCATG